MSFCRWFGSRDQLSPTPYTDLTIFGDSRCDTGNLVRFFLVGKSLCTGGGRCVGFVNGIIVGVVCQVLAHVAVAEVDDLAGDELAD